MSVIQARRYYPTSQESPASELHNIPIKSVFRFNYEIFTACFLHDNRVLYHISTDSSSIDTKLGAKLAALIILSSRYCLMVFFLSSTKRSSPFTRYRKRSSSSSPTKKCMSTSEVLLRTCGARWWWLTRAPILITSRNPRSHFDKHPCERRERQCIRNRRTGILSGMRRRRGI